MKKYVILFLLSLVPLSGLLAQHKQKGKDNSVDPLYLSTIDTTEYYFGNPKPSFKTNLLAWATLVPNLEVEFYLGKDYTINHYSINVEGNFTRLSFKNGARTYRSWAISPELRYYLAEDNSFTGHYFGLYAHAGEYSLMVTKKEKGNQGDYIGAGISYGWIKPISKHFDLELGLAAGWINTKYDTYGWYDPCYPYKKTVHKNTFLPTKAKISLIYRY